MEFGDMVGGGLDAAVADAFALYWISIGHSAGGFACRKLVDAGKIRLLVPAVAFSVAASRRTCGDSGCTEQHARRSAPYLRQFAAVGAVSIINLTPNQMIAAGRLYEQCLDECIAGEEVLAACHSAVAAKDLGYPLLSTARARYCYIAYRESEFSCPVEIALDSKRNIQMTARSIFVPESSRWFKSLTPPGLEQSARARLICFPHSGGTAYSFRPLGALLGGDVRTIGVQYPGRQDRYDEPVMANLHELADEVCSELSSTSHDIPFIFFGHSMGAILAYEVACRLPDHNIVELIASGRPAPSRVRMTTVYRLSDADLADHVMSLGGTAVGLLSNAEMRALLLPVIRGDYQASETYRPRAGDTVKCPLIALSGDADPTTTPSDIRAWSDHTRSRFCLESFPGGHFFLFDHWPKLAELIRSAAWNALHHASVTATGMIVFDECRSLKRSPLLSLISRRLISMTLTIGWTGRGGLRNCPASAGHTASPLIISGN